VPPCKRDEVFDPAEIEESTLVNAQGTTQKVTGEGDEAEKTASTKKNLGQSSGWW